MSDLTVTPGALRFCPDCLDVFGTAGDGQKPCSCARSAGVALRHGPRDFPEPFAICLYCSAAIISSGTKWSGYQCEPCGRRVGALNDQLDGAGMVSLPVGFHSLRHARWAHARPFTTLPQAQAWARARLRRAWEARSGEGDEWLAVAAAARSLVPADRSDLAELALSLRAAPRDVFIEALNRINSRQARR